MKFFIRFFTFIFAIALLSNSAFAQSKKTSAESTQWRQVAKYHSALVELMNHHVEVFNDTADTAPIAEKLFKQESDETPSFKTISPPIDGDSAALSPPTQLGAEQAEIRTLISATNNAYLDYKKNYEALQRYTEELDKGKDKYRYQLDQGKTGLQLVERLYALRKQFSSTQQQLSQSIEKISDSLFLKSIEKDPLKPYLVFMNGDLNAAKRILRAFRSKSVNDLPQQIASLKQMQKQHAAVNDKGLHAQASNVLSNYTDFYLALNSFVDAAVELQTKNDAKLDISTDFSSLVEIYNGMISSFNNFTDR